MVYLAMISTTIDNILCFLGPHTLLILLKNTSYIDILPSISNLNLAVFCVFKYSIGSFLAKVLSGHIDQCYRNNLL